MEFSMNTINRLKSSFINILFIGLTLYLLQSYFGKIGAQYDWMKLSQVVFAYRSNYISLDADKIQTKGDHITQNGEKFIANTSQDDFFIYGPYTPIFAGKYWLSISGVAFGEGKVGHVQISADKGKNILFSQDIFNTDFPIEEIMDLPTANNVEIRIASFVDNGSFLVSNITLKRLDTHIMRFISSLDNTLIQRLREFRNLKAYK